MIQKSEFFFSKYISYKKKTLKSLFSNLCFWEISPSDEILPLRKHCGGYSWCCIPQALSIRVQNNIKS
jgi:hypothetical protein